MQKSSVVAEKTKSSAVAEETNSSVVAEETSAAMQHTPGYPCSHGGDGDSDTSVVAEIEFCKASSHIAENADPDVMEAGDTPFEFAPQEISVTFQDRDYCEQGPTLIT